MVVIPTQWPVTSLFHPPAATGFTIRKPFAEAYPSPYLCSTQNDHITPVETFRYAGCVLSGWSFGFDGLFLTNPQQKGSTFGPVAKVGFSPGVFASMSHASIFRLILQCGTTGADAIIILIYTPTVGLGCRSPGHIIYGATTIIIMLLSISTISARISENPREIPRREAHQRDRVDPPVLPPIHQCPRQLLLQRERHRR